MQEFKNLPKRLFYNTIHYDLDIKNSMLIVKPEIFALLKNNQFDNGKNKIGFKKIGGSSMGDVLLTDGFKSHFSAYCQIMRLKPPVLAQKYINTGIAVEPKIFNLLQEKLPNKKILHIVAEEYNYDYFSGKYSFFNGVPDGIMPEEKRVLEMKTVNIKKRELWEKNSNSNIPEDYRKQAQIYAYLLGYSEFSIVAAYVQEQDYLNPENIDLKFSQLGIYNFKVNKNEAFDDFKKVENFYKIYSNSNISPKFNPIKEKDLIEYLLCKNLEEWQNLLKKWQDNNKADKNLIAC